ncbi:uncharacterized protein B0I36DRAFT_378688 [Microdochium trichocladiopsis]|uniref:Heterokaryon incompatibility domain-containing protein n=1 Tax=Microdochium trichocladiopsis TaxID=1682393 RepID=A0A9P8XQL6_9PEZI|nr:uncharacterized protein B0I36DRAFT_378688 [Microdochium trichocladiopsis]KAH7007950.1 hypothetical protein B0I36DRAFT_378688 [Microdochium trichocladiopsis]
MRLLRTDDLRFEEFHGHRVPPYAILSHRWRELELSYHDLGHTAIEPRAQSYRKIMSSRDEARRATYQYIWVDTCCINKSSSAELQEAINSTAMVYFAYLDDVDLSKASTTYTPTLQELLAPKALVFYDRKWARIGDSEELRSLISRITGIDSQYISSTRIGGESLRVPRIGRRMSWASNRDTERLEDRAYVLLGIFDVNIAMLYREGQREEILKCNEDASILV